MPEIHDPADLPLRLRRRRDGSLALTDASGAVAGETRQFPPRHLFLYSWLYGEGSTVTKVGEDSVVLTLANGVGTYGIIEHENPGLDAQGIYCELVDASYTDLVPIDEEKAAERAAERALDQPGVSLTEEQAEAAARAMGEEV